MKSEYVLLISTVLLAISVPAGAALVTSMDITVGGMDYTATFHDYADELSPEQ